MFVYWGLRRARVNRQRMDVAAHQFSGGSIDHPMPFQRGNAGKARRRDHDVEMATFASPGVAGVFGAVIANLEQTRMQSGFERCTQAIRSRTRAHGADSFDSFENTPRSRYNTTPTMKIMAKGTAIQTLKVTQSASLRVLATQMFANPSST